MLPLLGVFIIFTFFCIFHILRYIYFIGLIHIGVYVFRPTIMGKDPFLFLLLIDKLPMSKNKPPLLR